MMVVHGGNLAFIFCDFTVQVLDNCKVCKHL